MMERTKQLGKINASCILETAGHLIDHAGRVTDELRGVTIAIHLNGVDRRKRLGDSLGDLRHDIDVAIGEKVGVLHAVVCFRLSLDAGGDTLVMLLLPFLFNIYYYSIILPSYAAYNLPKRL